MVLVIASGRFLWAVRRDHYPDEIAQARVWLWLAAMAAALLAAAL